MCHVPVCTAHPPYAVVTKVRLKMNVVKAKFFNFHTKKRSTIAGIFALQIKSLFLAFLLFRGHHKHQNAHPKLARRGKAP